jgi:hypothetical protein
MEQQALVVLEDLRSILINKFKHYEILKTISSTKAEIYKKMAESVRSYPKHFFVQFSMVPKKNIIYGKS